MTLDIGARRLEQKKRRGKKEIEKGTKRETEGGDRERSTGHVDADNVSEVTKGPRDIVRG